MRTSAGAAGTNNLGFTANRLHRCACGPEVGHAGRQPASANCVQTMWLAEHGLHSDSGYLPKELMGQRDKLSDKDFNDTITSKIQLPM